MEEIEIIEKAKSGDRNALSELVKKYEQTIFNFAFKICRNKDRAENTMQETFLSMVKNIGQFDRKSKLSTWLYTIVSNHCLMMARAKKKDIYTSLDDEENILDESKISDWSVSPERIAENEELKEMLDKVITKLPVEYRIVFLLRDVEGLSAEETGKIVNISIPAVKSRLHRARAFLRKEINKMI